MVNHVTPADDDSDGVWGRQNIELFTAVRLLNVSAFEKLLCAEVTLHINQGSSAEH